jgi:hypothetical protein
LKCASSCAINRYKNDQSPKGKETRYPDNNNISQNWKRNKMKKNIYLKQIRIKRKKMYPSNPTIYRNSVSEISIICLIQPKGYLGGAEGTRNDLTNFFVILFRNICLIFLISSNVVNNIVNINKLIYIVYFSPSVSEFEDELRILLAALSLISSQRF